MGYRSSPANVVKVITSKRVYMCSDRGWCHTSKSQLHVVQLTPIPHPLSPLQPFSPSPLPIQPPSPFSPCSPLAPSSSFPPLALLPLQLFSTSNPSSPPAPLPPPPQVSLIPKNKYNVMYISVTLQHCFWSCLLTQLLTLADISTHTCNMDSLYGGGRYHYIHNPVCPYPIHIHVHFPICFLQ